MIQHAIRYSCLFAVVGFLLPTAVAAKTLPTKDLTLEAGAFKETLAPETVATWFARSITLVTDPTYTAEVENFKVPCSQKTAACFLITTTAAQQHSRATEDLTLDTEAVATYVTDLAKRVDTPPRNARLGMRNGSAYVRAAHVDGRAIDQDATLIELTSLVNNAADAIPETLTIPTETTPAKVRDDNYHTLGFTTIIGRGESDFSGSPVNRVHNIRTAANRFDGVILAPGEEFSFVRYLGAVNAATGYREELVIKDNQTKPEFGGGVCQVSTTIFRSAIFSGLKITQRRNHSYPVRYYQPVGLDATIYIPSPDMRFVNNTPGYVMLSMRVEGMRLFFDLYGTPDGRKVAVDGPHVTESNPDGSMKTYFVQKVKTNSGSIMINDTFSSNYKSPKDYQKPGVAATVTSPSVPAGTTPILQAKPKDWSKKEWKAYKKNHGL